jgi:hypothetical protein
VPELGNLTVCIFLPPGRLSTVKIRTGSLFCTVDARIGALEADFRPARHANPVEKPAGPGFPPLSTAPAVATQDVHRRHRFKTCAMSGQRCKV